VTETQRGGVILRRVVWPWEAATTRLTEEVTPSAEIQVPCTEEVITPEPAVEGEPYLQVEPICGKMTTEDGVQGTLVTLTVSGLQPGTTAELWWADPIGNKFRQRIDGDAVEVTTDENGQATVAVPIPYRLIPPSAREGAMIWTVEFRQEVEYGDLIASESLILAIEAMIETIFLGMMSTAFGIVLALPLSFMAARNLMRANWFTLGIYYVVRLMLNIIRSIEPMIWAVIRRHYCPHCAFDRRPRQALLRVNRIDRSRPDRSHPGHRR
jgi:phosphonate transport system permease protein